MVNEIESTLTLTEREGGTSTTCKQAKKFGNGEGNRYSGVPEQEWEARKKFDSSPIEKPPVLFPSLFQDGRSKDRMDNFPLDLLVVDDEEPLLLLAKATLEGEGYRVRCAKNGEEALTLAFETPPSLFVCDVVMPGMTGLQLLREIRNRPSLRDSYVILLTARSDIRDIVDGFSATADDYLRKPFDLKELVVRVHAGARLQRTREHLKETNLRLEELLRRHSELLGLTMHDLRNPLNVITSYISLLGKGIVSEETIKDVCLRRARDMARLIDAMLQMNRLETGRFSLRPFSINAALLFHDTARLFEPLAREKKIEFTYEAPTEIPIVSDDHYLVAVLQGFFSCAIEMTPSGYVRALLQSEPEELVFTLLSSASFLPSDSMSVFDPLLAASSMSDPLSTTQRLSLAIAAKTIGVLGGSVFASQEETGTRMGFVLPRRAENPFSGE